MSFVDRLVETLSSAEMQPSWLLLAAVAAIGILASVVLKG